MGRRLTRVERASKALHDESDRVGRRSDEDFCSRPLGDWKPPAPHAPQMVSLGHSVHHDLVVKSDYRTTADLISQMVNQSK